MNMYRNGIVRDVNVEKAKRMEKEGWHDLQKYGTSNPNLGSEQDVLKQELSLIKKELEEAKREFEPMLNELESTRKRCADLEKENKALNKKLEG